ncbi:helix-turn-helix domain-containing protein [Curvivirga sp.]|uniref:helix-turn-helix domain-containing protein n=1 Tax=Curvivirga sp. TaxID=2856848 RepID=UPI003B5C7868
MNKEDAKKLAEAYIDCCHSGFEERISEIFSPDSYIFDTATARVIAPDSLIEDVRLLRRAFPHVRFELTQYALCDDQNMMVRWRLVRNSIPSDVLDKIGGLNEDYTGVDFLKLNGNQIVQTQSYLDRSGETLEYFARRINQELNEQEIAKYKAGAGRQEKSDQLIFENLKSMMTVEKLYRNSKIRMPAIAKLLGIGSNHLSRVVNQLADQNFNDYLNGYRIADAKLLLEQVAEDKRLTMGQVALKCGFNSQSVFNAVFKARVGVTPLQYRMLRDTE